MGSEKVKLIKNEQDRRQFMESMLKDLKALDYMIKNDMFEVGNQRIGAEQELYLVNKHWRPTPIVMELLALLDDKDFTTEYARFNIELNLPPYLFTGKVFSKMELQLKTKLRKVEQAAQSLDAHIVQVGILPSVRRKDIGEHNITPLKRYKLLTQALHDLRGGLFDIHISGTDELNLKEAHSLYEASNTSFQLHYQVTPENFASSYNWAQAVAAPLMAVCGNSPLLLGHRLWQETRIALFQQSIDIRSNAEFLRGNKPRVYFGDGWIKESVMEIYQEDIARYRVLLQTTHDEDPLEMLKNGKIPKLGVLSTHNGTVYRWNRPCYGITDGKPHIRIENRIIPSGPTTTDQIANAAFWTGMMKGMPDEYKNINETTDFDYAKTNFIKAARYGLDTQFRWVGNKKPVAAKDLIIHELLPIARKGLEKANINSSDIDKYLGIIEQRILSGKTGAKWQVRSFEKLKRSGSVDEALIAVTAGMYQRQQEGKPVHTWELADQSEAGGWLSRYRTVRQIMSTDLFIVNEKDSASLVANIMNWKEIRHILVENDSKDIVGVISVRDLLKWFTSTDKSQDMPSVYQLMTPAPINVTPDTSTLDALRMMHSQSVGCIPVMEESKLLGIVTEHDFSKLALHLMNEIVEHESIPKIDSLTS